jgi:ABC-type Mn2+/Zn2+ transport system ATPase subunit
MGLLRRSAARAAGVALESLEITGLAKRKIGTLSAVERRVVLFAHAILGRPSVIFADRPLAHLPDEAAGEVRAALERAAHGRRLIASVEAPAGAGHELNLLSSMDRVAVMEASTLVMVGPPAEALKPSPRCVVVAARHATALASALADRGLRVERDEPGSETGRLVVHLPDGGSSQPIVEAALEVDAPLIELVSVGLDPPG